MDVFIGANNRRPLQVRRCTKAGWTKRRRTVFLDTLAQTCNVSMAEKAAGVANRSAYALRKRDAGFAALWHEALTAGYGRLEEALLGHALQAINDIVIADDACAPFSIDDETPPSGAARLVAPRLPDASVRLALALLDRHRRTVEGTGAIRGPRKIATATMEETDAALRKKLDVLARKLKAQRPQDPQ